MNFPEKNRIVQKQLAGDLRETEKVDFFLLLQMFVHGETQSSSMVCSGVSENTNFHQFSPHNICHFFVKICEEL